MNWKLGIAIAATALLAGAANANAATINISIKGFKFTPAAVTAHIGDKIVWTNEDPTAHTATATDKAFDLPVAPGKSASLMIAKKGAFDYFCKIHPHMKGTLTVD